MYLKNFLDAGVDEIAKAVDLKESNFNSLGINNKRHQRILESSLSGFALKSN